MAKTHRSALELTETGSVSGLYLASGNSTAAATQGQINFVSGTGFEFYDSSVISLSSTALTLPADGLLAFNSASDTATSATGQVGYYTGRGFQCYDGAVLPIVGATMTRTPTSDGTGTGTIPAGVKSVVVENSTDTNHIIVLPAATAGTEIWIDSGTTTFELRSSAPATIGINGGTASTAESQIDGGYLVRCFAITGGTMVEDGTATANWICTKFYFNGTESAVEAAA